MRSGSRLRPHSGPIRRRGLGAAEVVVGLCVLAAIGLILLMLMPRQREKARTVACQQNLREIGDALRQYSQATDMLPTVPALGGREPARPGTLGALLVELDLRDFRKPAGPNQRPVARGGAPLAELPVPGFVCPSDPNATAGIHPAPISYRACTGDRADGRNGAFAPGKVVTLADIEDGDGLGYTAAFSERLVGDGHDGAIAMSNYAIVPGAVVEAASPLPADAGWKGDAGSSWLAADWRSTLMTHAIPPGGAPSTIALDGKAARMGASGGHEGLVHVLILDGSVRPYTYRVDPAVWRALATLKDGEIKVKASGGGSGPRP